MSEGHTVEARRDYFLCTPRIGFSLWAQQDGELARALWGDGQTTRYLCASGVFTGEQIQQRLQTEIRNQLEHGVQYWPIFALQSGVFLGCCGLRPYGQEPGVYELGFHLRSPHWGQGFGSEAAQAVIAYAFERLKASALFAGHHPDNANSRKTLLRLGFVPAGEQFYEPTGRMHPSYWYKKEG